MALTEGGSHVGGDAARGEPWWEPAQGCYRSGGGKEAAQPWVGQRRGCEMVRELSACCSRQRAVMVVLQPLPRCCSAVTEQAYEKGHQRWNPGGEILLTGVVSGRKALPMVRAGAFQLRYGVLLACSLVEVRALGKCR